MRAQLLARPLIVIAGLACASAHNRAPASQAPAPAHDAFAIYDQYGLIVVPLGGVGQCFFRPGPTSDSTRMTFFLAHVPSEGAGLDLTRGGTLVHRFQMPPESDFRETVTLAPGVYHLEPSYFDDRPFVVPRMDRASLATPIPMQHDRILPHAIAIIGRDTTIDVYVEAYGPSHVSTTLSAPGWRDTIALERHGDTSSGTVHVPLSRLGPGPTRLVLARGRDSVTTSLFVGFSDQTALSFDWTIDALRYLAPPERLESLRHTPPNERPQAWATFMAQYGSRIPEYFTRVREANRRYHEANLQGWETDRGSAYVQLGDPDQVFVEPDIEIWVYTRYFGRLKFDHGRLAPESRQMLTTLVAQARSAR